MDNNKNTENKNSGKKEIMNEEPESSDTKKSSVKTLLKIVLIIAVIALGFYFIYFKATSSRALFLVSNSEITSKDDVSKQNLIFKPTDKVFFLISRKGDEYKLEADLIVIEIEYFDKNAYSKYKKLSYEIGKEFQKLSAYIPSEYFTRSGKYKIKASLDGKLIEEREIQVESAPSNEEKK